ncbi:hypothetical protein ACLBKU_07935 [Erythrobacter sp. NE805]|uniref:hypothetical protein n=1 Tax=Erythrobacter sp. NE805 TaxID=3389875 RepID=UPI00396B289D
MKSVLLLPVLVALAAIPAPLMADSAPREGDAPAGATPARLIAFTGGRELLKESARLRVWRAEVAYRLAVDPEGTPTDCELTERFRMKHVNDTLCAVLLRTHSFEPAHDATGQAVEGTYAGRLNYQELRESR